jgi:hypothetical protein
VRGGAVAEALANIARKGDTLRLGRAHNGVNRVAVLGVGSGKGGATAVPVEGQKDLVWLALNHEQVK